MEKKDLTESYKNAAKAIHEADVLLLVTGAGWSADSGLPVFADIANIPAFRCRGLSYADLAQPRCLQTDPSLFYGFWGHTFNTYRRTEPHNGFSIVAQWRADKNATGAAQTIRRAVQDKMKELPAEYGPKKCVPYEVTGEPAGAFFCFTSNCDAHFYDYFPAQDIHDCHGSVELWQCSSRECDSGIWRVPLDHQFVVDTTSMTAHQYQADKRGRNAQFNRTNALKFMPPGTSAADWVMNGHWPECRRCQALARPAIFMFGDFGWKYDTEQSTRWDIWKEAVLEQEEMSICVVEIGCGHTVQTCRSLSEETVLSFGGQKATLVRINPDDPHSSDSSVTNNHLIAIETGGLDAIGNIHAEYQKLQRSGI